MPLIEVDFETFKAITVLRPSESVSEGEVVRWKLGLPSLFDSKDSETEVKTGAALSESNLIDSIAEQFWVSEGVKFRVGDELRHWFRDQSEPARAVVSETGLVIDGKTFKSLSMAAIHYTGYNTNGWRFWMVKSAKGDWRIAEQLRK